MHKQSSSRKLAPSTHQIELKKSTFTNSNLYIADDIFTYNIIIFISKARKSSSHIIVNHSNLFRINLVTLFRGATKASLKVIVCRCKLLQTCSAKAQGCLLGGEYRNLDGSQSCGQLRITRALLTRIVRTIQFELQYVAFLY